MSKMFTLGLLGSGFGRLRQFRRPIHTLSMRRGRWLSGYLQAYRRFW